MKTKNNGKQADNCKNIEKLRKIDYTVKVPFYACTYKARGTKNAKKGNENKEKYYSEIIKLLEADGWTLKTMGEVLTCGKSTCPELTRGNESLYCHPEELTGEVADEKRLADVLSKAETFRIVKREACDIYVCGTHKLAEQLYRDMYGDSIADVIRDVVYLQTGIYEGRKGGWIDYESAVRIISKKIYLPTKDINHTYNSIAVVENFVKEELIRLDDCNRIWATTNKHGQMFIKWIEQAA